MVWSLGPKALIYESLDPYWVYGLGMFGVSDYRRKGTTCYPVSEYSSALLLLSLVALLADRLLQPSVEASCTTGFRL